MYGFKPELLTSSENYDPNQLTPMQLLSYPQMNCPILPVENLGYHWINTTIDSGVPHHAVVGGTDQDGTTIYVGRAYHDGDYIPAKVIPQRHEAYIAYGGQEIKVNSFEVLCEQRFEWVHSSCGNVPHNAVEGGRTSDGETLYIGRTFHEGSHTVGKVHPSHGVLYIPFGGEELKYENYEILVLM